MLLSQTDLEVAARKLNHLGEHRLKIVENHPELVPNNILDHDLDTLGRHIAERLSEQLSSKKALKTEGYYSAADSYRGTNSRGLNDEDIVAIARTIFPERFAGLLGTYIDLRWSGP